MAFFFVFFSTVIVSTILLGFKIKSLKNQLLTTIIYTAVITLLYYWLWGIIILSLKNILFYLMGIAHYCLHSKPFKEHFGNDVYMSLERIWHPVDCLMIAWYFADWYPNNVIFLIQAILLWWSNDEHHRYIYGSVGFYIAMLFRYFQLNGTLLCFEIFIASLIFTYVAGFHYRKHLGYVVDEKYNHQHFMVNPPGLAFMFRAFTL